MTRNREMSGPIMDSCAAYDPASEGDFRREDISWDIDRRGGGDHSTAHRACDSPT